jgi:hypothetical protein
MVTPATAGRRQPGWNIEILQNLRMPKDPMANRKYRPTVSGRFSEAVGSRCRGSILKERRAATISAVYSKSWTTEGAHRRRLVR